MSNKQRGHMRPVYLSGSITDADRLRQQQNVTLFGKYQLRLDAMGLLVHNPAAVEYPDWTWEQYLARDLLWIARHEPVLYMLPNWKISKGARLEYEFAKQLGLPIVEDPNIEELVRLTSQD